MAQISYRANLSTAIFPMSIARAGRSVIIPQADQNFDRRVDPEGEQKSAGIPQIMYGENILPTTEGYQSVGYSTGGALPATGGLGQRYQFIDIVSIEFGKATLAISAVGTAYWTSDGVSWGAVTIVGTPPGQGSTLSTGVVRQVCYVFVGGQLYTCGTVAGFFTLTNVSASVTPVGTLTLTRNICAAFNYLILLKTDGTVFWSSTTVPTDFTPSLVTGAGSGAPNGLVGFPLFIRTTPEGFFVSTEESVVHATYTGNARYPFRFVPVQNAAGVALEFVANTITGGEASLSHYAITPQGYIQQLTSREATLVGQEFSELFNRLTYTDVFNQITNVFSVDTAPTPTTGKRFFIYYLLERYVVVSVCFRDEFTFQYAYVYDHMFRRWGKFNLNHDYVTSFGDRLYFCQNGFSITNTNTFFLESDINRTDINFAGVLLLGKFEYVRSRFLALDEISVECGQLGSIVPEVSRDFSLHTITTLNGKNFQPAVSPTLDTSRSTGDVLTYNSSAEGKNVSLLFKGAFDLTSVEMTFHLGGKY